ncbi:hypothetical protein PsorP6_014156 [Peronosclerospora sorghi]|uniref:Uncharacterized protein n=1 Tax=Peronosclerospora sorghi TaxID=230839 RepID=A0ACC0VJ09_9STRA|nr:hypothetical protein PsorP6_014156 [Peronosclerospora sorghi]
MHTRRHFLNKKSPSHNTGTKGRSRFVRVYENAILIDTLVNPATQYAFPTSSPQVKKEQRHLADRVNAHGFTSQLLLRKFNKEKKRMYTDFILLTDAMVGVVTSYHRLEDAPRNDTSLFLLIPQAATKWNDGQALLRGGRRQGTRVLREDRRERVFVGDLKKAVKVEKSAMITCDADELQLFLAWKNGACVTEADVVNGVTDTTGLKPLDVAGAPLNTVGLSEENVRSQVTEEAVLAKKTPVHVLVIVPEGRDGSPNPNSRHSTQCMKLTFDRDSS